MDDDGTRPVPQATGTVAPDAIDVEEVTTGSRSLGRGYALAALGVLLFLASVAGWWAQDAIGTVVNVGEADIGETVTFTADGGSYRLLSSGPLRPAPESTYCDLTYGERPSTREVGGQGLQTSRLGVDRLLTFEPPPGRVEVRCTSRGSDVTGNGRFQVLEADGIVSKALIATIVVALLSLAAGIALVVRGYRTTTTTAAAGPSGIRGVTAGWSGAFDPGGFTDDDEHDPTPDPD